MNKKEYQKKYDKERYKWLKEHHICLRCKKEKAQENSLYCLVCKMDKREIDKQRKLTTEQKERRRINKKRRYDILVAFGICPRCGVRKKKSNSIFCSRCSAIRNVKAKNKRIEDRKIPRELFGNGKFCSICGKPTENEKLQCPRCLENSRKSIKKAQTKSWENKENYFAKSMKQYFEKKVEEK